MSGEKAPIQSHEHARPEELAPQHSKEHADKLAERAEAAKPLSEKEARREVKQAEQAIVAAEEESRAAEAHTQAPPRRAPTIRDKDLAYGSIMTNTRRHMSTPARTFSKFIHNKAIDTTSEVTGRTIARPTSILLGSMGAFIVVLGVYWHAKHNGYRLSGSEFIAVFAIGWFAGLLADFLKNMVTGGQIK